MKKITLATLKSFIKKNKENLFINVTSSFDGMTDGIESRYGGFEKAIVTDSKNIYTQGVKNAYFVGGSRDYFQAYEANGMTGFKVRNCCGAFILAIKN